MHHNLLSKIRIAAVNLVDAVTPKLALWIRYIINYNTPYRHEILGIVSLLSPQSQLIDVGARVGFFSFTITRLRALKLSRITLIDPIPFNTRSLHRSFHGSNAFIFPCLVSDENSGRYINKKFSLLSDIARTKTSSHKSASVSSVTSITLAQLSQIIDIRSCDLIKVDVEGHELNVLKGLFLPEIDVKPILYIEIELAHASRQSIDEISRLIYSKSYRSFFYDKKASYFSPFKFSAEQLEPLQSNKLEYINNFLFIPPSINVSKNPYFI